MKIGDVVRLKSGSPKMTVVRKVQDDPSVVRKAPGEPTVEVQWHGNDLQVKSHLFPEVCLVDAEAGGEAGEGTL